VGADLSFRKKGILVPGKMLLRKETEERRGPGFLGSDRQKKKVAFVPIVGDMKRRKRQESVRGRGRAYIAGEGKRVEKKDCQIRKGEKKSY